MHNPLDETHRASCLRENLTSSSYGEGLETGQASAKVPRQSFTRQHRSRRLIHCNVTAHPTAAWTLQQLRESIGLQERYEYLLHDRDSIFAQHLDESMVRLGVKVLKSPPQSPTGQLDLRKSHRDYPPRVPRLADSPD